MGYENHAFPWPALLNPDGQGTQRGKTTAKCRPGPMREVQYSVKTNSRCSSSTDGRSSVAVLLTCMRWVWGSVRAMGRLFRFFQSRQEAPNMDPSFSEAFNNDAFADKGPPQRQPSEPSTPDEHTPGSQPATGRQMQGRLSCFSVLLRQWQTS